MSKYVLRGNRWEINHEDENFPLALKKISDPPDKLYVIGDLSALKEGLAVVGARKATPYGLSCAKHYAKIAALKSIPIISGGAMGCDSASHKAALEVGGKTVVFLGGGCNKIYPFRNFSLFQKIVDSGGAIVSEKPWDFEPLRYTFLARNRLIAALARATLIVEAGLPSGTFSTADYAIKYNREVWAVPGPVTHPLSAGCNSLIYDGATPVVNDDVFNDMLFYTFNCLKSHEIKTLNNDNIINELFKNPIIIALRASSLTMEQLYDIAKKQCKKNNVNFWLSEILIQAESAGLIARYNNGKYGPCLK